MDWPAAQREQWLETARNIFAILYHDAGDLREPIPLRPRAVPGLGDAASTYPSKRHIA